MSPHRDLLADARFLLPEPVRTVALRDGATGWTDRLLAQGLVVHTSDDVPADLAVGASARSGELAALGRHRLLLDGRGRTGTGTLAVLPRTGDPTVLLPVGGGAVTREAVTVWSARTTRTHRALASAAGAVVGAGYPAGLPRLRLLPASPGLPWMVAAAVRAGLATSGPVVLAPGRRGSRSVLVVADPSGRLSTVVKFSRDPRLVAPFQHEEVAHARLAEVGPLVQRHSPVLRGSLSVHGHCLLVEDFAPGLPLLSLLPHASGRAPLAAVGRWLVGLAAGTRGDPGLLGPERRRLSHHLDHPAAGPDARAALAGLGAVPPVLEHGDLGPNNVVVTADGFTALDWETLRRPGWPLWDLLFAFEEAHAWTPDGDGMPRGERFVRLMRGERPGSAALFAQVRATVEALGLDPADVGRLATLCWADRAVAVARAAAAGSAIDPAGDGSFHLARPRLWAADPALGPGWDAWR